MEKKSGKAVGDAYGRESGAEVGRHFGVNRSTIQRLRRFQQAGSTADGHRRG